MMVLGLGLTIEPIWIGPGLFLLGNWWSGEARRLAPPFVLLLGDTGEFSRNIAADILVSVFPLQSTDLLQVLSNREMIDWAVKSATSRLNNEVVNWKAAVEIHAKAAKIIVLQIQNPTSYVLEELEIINNGDIWWKVIILGDVNHIQLYFDASRIPFAAVSGSVFFSDYEKLMIGLRHLRKNFAIVPTKEIPISKLLNEAGIV